MNPLIHANYSHSNATLCRFARCSLLAAASGTGVRRPPTPAAVANQVRRLSTLNLKVNLSEFDVRTSSLSAHLDPEDVQKEIVRDILSACFSQPNFTGVYFWGVSDAVSWVEDFYGNVDKPLILDSSYSTKPSHQGGENGLAAILLQVKQHYL